MTRTKIIRLYQDEVIDIMRNGGTKINAHDKCCVVILAFFYECKAYTRIFSFVVGFWCFQSFVYNHMYYLFFFNICFGFRKKLKLRCLTHQKDCRRVPQSDPGLDVISLLIAGSPCIVTWLMYIGFFFIFFYSFSMF